MFLGVQVPKDAVVITGTPQIYSSSPWAQRAFCGTCGANLWYQVTAPGPYQGTYHVAFGGLQDKDGIDLREEIYIDRKPDAFSFAQKTKTEVEAMFAPPN